MTLDEAKKLFEIQENGLIDKDVLKKKFKILAKKYHPDTGGSEESFKEFQSAYQLLLKYKSDDLASMVQDFINNFVKQGVINPSQVWKEYKSTSYREYPNGFNYKETTIDDSLKKHVVSLTVAISKVVLMSETVFPNEQKIKEMIYVGLISQLPKGKFLPVDWEKYLTRQVNDIGFGIIFKYNGPIMDL